MTGARTAPAWLDVQLPCWRTPRTEPGLFAVVDPAADTSWARETVAGDDTEHLLWLGTGHQPERLGLQTAQRHGVRAVSLVPAGRDLRRVWASIQFAYHLRGIPTDDATSALAHLTSTDPPIIVDQAIRIPHLVTRRYSTGNVADVVIWELVPRVAAPSWARIPPASQSFIEAHLPGLLAISGAARTGRLPRTEQGQRLVTILAGRPLNIRLVYRHLNLIRPLLTDIPSPVERCAPTGSGRELPAARP